MANLFQKIGLIPRYTEVSLFLTALTFVLVYLSNNEAASIVTGFAVLSTRMFLLFIFYVLGLIFSFYYAVSDKETPSIAKLCMLIFIMLTNLGVALFAFISISREVHDYYIIFPALNVINALIILTLFRAKIVDENCISDENARPVELLIGSAAVLILFLISQYVLKNYWAITFSICLSYSSIINDAVTRTLFREKKV
jgi:hypothetical protein